MKLRSVVVGLLLSSLVLVACGREASPTASGAKVPVPSVATDVIVQGSPTFARMTQRDTVVIGVKNDQPGLGYLNPKTNRYEGFDIEIARLIAAKLGFDPQTKIDYKPIPSAAREQAISNGQIDYYVGTYTINDARKKQISFAGPYFIAGQSLLVKADDKSITGPDTLKGKRVCSATGSTPIQRVRQQGLTDQIVEFQTYSQCVDQLLAGQVDAVTTDDAILKGYAAQDPQHLKVVGKPFSQEPYGVGLPLADNALRAKVNDILEAAAKDGTWTQIYNGTLGASGSSATPPAVDRY
ncbi:MAG: glutamate ABC transporter substrate-binding protein [Pseudonocardiaceae bacterium]|jgi:glutamate transport system substrate-binding protein|nr:glutamate ABC transporter substrate-binding protein [Pseudonocardiaceae bacterium]